MGVEKIAFHFSVVDMKTTRLDRIWWFFRRMLLAPKFALNNRAASGNGVVMLGFIRGLLYWSEGGATRRTSHFTVKCRVVLRWLAGK